MSKTKQEELCITCGEYASAMHGWYGKMAAVFRVPVPTTGQCLVCRTRIRVLNIVADTTAQSWLLPKALHLYPEHPLRKRKTLCQIRCLITASAEGVMHIPT